MSSSRRDLFRAAAAAARDAALAARDAPPPASEPRLEPAEIDRYSRQLVLAQWGEAEQLRLREASVLVVGAGALGSPVAAYLAGAGVGRLGVLDGDEVELSNLPRQFLHFTPDIGAAKVQSAAAKLRFLNPDVEIDPYHVTLDAANAAALVEGHDLVVDCSDSFATRYAVNAACCAAGVDLVEGGVVGFEGLVLAVRPRASACYRCAFPVAPAPGGAPSCAEAGVLGPAAGVVGSLQALEALKLLAGLPALLDTLVRVDLADASLTHVRTARRLDCPDCGD